jgi:hypothetical protein
MSRNHLKKNAILNFLIDNQTKPVYVSFKAFFASYPKEIGNFQARHRLMFHSEIYRGPTALGCVTGGFAFPYFFEKTGVFL